MNPEEIVAYPEKFTILLTINPNNAQTSYSREYAENEGMIAKSEFHVTVIGHKTGQALQELFVDLSEEGAKEKFMELVKMAKSMDWSFTFKSKQISQNMIRAFLIRQYTTIQSRFSLEISCPCY